MKKTLVVVESPTKAKTIGKFLGKDYIVKASMGHIRDLPEKNLGVDTNENYEPEYVVSRKKNAVLKELKEDMKKVDNIFLATDEDREGEAIAWHLMHALKIKKNDYKRIVFHEITKEAIKKAIDTPRMIDQDLVDAQQARRVLDRLVGYKLSPFLWKKVRKGLSAGRVQSVAVRLIVEREREIEAFTPEEYWDFIVDLLSKDDSSFQAKLEAHKGKKIKVGSEKEANAIKKEIGDIKTYIVEEVKKKEAKKTPPAPFTTSTLQQEASRKFGYSVKQTMMIAQQLYEGIDIGSGTQGLITYMRTDSVNLAESALKQAKEVITAEYGKEYALSSPRKYKTKSKGAQEAHEAIRPTDLSLTPDAIASYLDPKQLRIYKLIWKRTVATQMAEAKLENTTAKLFPEGKEEYTFHAKGSVILFPGFMKLYIETKEGDEEEEKGLLPPMEEGDKSTKKDFQANQHFTKPPARYTEAALVKKLESEGIGRPSTYAPTISTIVDKGYIEKKEKHLWPTEIAFVVNDMLVKHFPNEVDYKFTAKLEEDFDEVAHGKTKWQQVVDGFYGPFEKTLDKKMKEVEKVEEKTGEKCDKCAHDMVIKFGRFGKFMACSNYPECKNIKPMKEEEERKKALEEEFKDKKCETCGSGLIVKSGRFGEFLACANYPECKYTEAITRSTGVKCPECGKGEFVERKSKRGKIFYSCSEYPDCKKALWNKPHQDPCKSCGGLLVWSKKGLVKCDACGEVEEKEE